jgi:carboxylate-amine ligase
VVRGLVGELEKALRELGDLDAVRDGVERVLRDGNGAGRQRAALRERGLAGVLDLITSAEASRG